MNSDAQTFASFSLSALTRQYCNQHHHQPHTPVRRPGGCGSAGSRRSDVELLLLLSPIQCNQCLSSDLVQHPQHRRHQHATSFIIRHCRCKRASADLSCSVYTSDQCTYICITHSALSDPQRVPGRFPTASASLKHACRDHLPLPRQSTRAVTRLAA